MTKDEVIIFLKSRLSFTPEEPLGIVEDNHVYSIISKANFVAIAVDEGEFLEIPKYEFMNSEQLCTDTEFYMENQDFDSAQACIECALRVDAESPNKNWKVYYYAGVIALKQKIYDASINLIEYSIKWGCPHLRNCFDYMAIAASILGRTNDAYQYYQSAIEQTPSDPQVWHNIGGFYWDNHYLKEAVQAYVKALECNISYFPTYEELSSLSEQLGNKQLSEIYARAYNMQNPINREVVNATAEWGENLS